MSCTFEPNQKPWSVVYRVEIANHWVKQLPELKHKRAKKWYLLQPVKCLHIDDDPVPQTNLNSG